MNSARVGNILREAIASARSQPVASLLTLLIVAGMMVAVMLTTGRTIAAEQRVISTIDSADTRSIVVRAEDGAGLTSDVISRIGHVEGIEWAGAFTSAVDATNTLVPDGLRVPARYVFTSNLEMLGVPESSALPGQIAYASPGAMEQLGLRDDVGAITLTTGVSVSVTGPLESPAFLASFEPLVLIPQPSPAGTETVNVIVVIAARPDLVAPVADAVLSVLAPDDPTKITVQTSEALAQLRALIQGQLGSYSRGLVLAMLGLTGALVAIVLYGLVMMRRKDFGRRRALGATRGFIVALLLSQTALLAIAGTTLGAGAAVAALLVAGDALPGIPFISAVAVLAIATATIAALMPALVASRREPICELRVP